MNEKKRYRIAYQVDGETEYIYRDYMMEVGAILRGSCFAVARDWHVEVLGADNKYYYLTTKVYGWGL